MPKAKKAAAKKGAVKKSVAKKKPAAKAVKKKVAVKKVTAKRVVKKAPVKRAPKKVPFVQKGYSSITPYLIVHDAVNAIEFYKKAFAAKEVMRMEKPDGRITHAELKIGDSKIMMADECPEMGACSAVSVGGSPVGIHLYMKDVDAVIERAVAAGAKLLRAAENMFYGDRTGALEDPFGHKWYVSTHIENVSMAQMKKRAAQLHQGE